jgi:glycosyltransferase involved in cell wall biosynthesis
VLLCTYHNYCDPSSGAALSSRDLLEMLARFGWSCRVFCGPLLDFERAESLPQILSDHRFPINTVQAMLGAIPFALHRFVHKNVGVTIFDTTEARPYQAPDREAGHVFLQLLERMFDQFEPDALLTYGGYWTGLEVIARAKRRGVPVIFALHNLSYADPQFFTSVDAVLVPSQFSQAHYRQVLKVDGAVLPGPCGWDRVRCSEVRGRYVTFVNPQPEKGVFVFARIADELGRRRPDIPFLVVEGRGQASWLSRTGLDLVSRGNVFVMANTPDPRQFYSVSRLILMPSLGQETFGRVAAEALLNGIPVLASRRGALPETLQNAGFLFDVPATYTPQTRQLPTAAEVAPWMEAIVRLWDDEQFYAEERGRCLAAAEAWRPENLLPRFEELFARAQRAALPK